jgi:hypothetical protein
METIKASELRIGNQVRFIGGDGFIENAEALLDIEQGIDLVQGIPLTEEILTKNLGAKYKSPMAGGQDEWSGYGFWEIKGFFFNGTKNGSVLYFARDWRIEIDTVHKLQNIISDFGQELEFKQ